VQVISEFRQSGQVFAREQRQWLTALEPQWPDAPDL